MADQIHTSKTERASLAMDKVGSVVQGLPSNEAVLHNLNKAKVELDRAKTAPEIDNTGRRILQDAELLVDDMKILIKERNEGDRLQILAREAQLAAEMIAKHSKDLGMAGKHQMKDADMKGLQAAARDGFKSLQMAVMEIARSGEFRSDLIEFLRFASDVFRSGVKDSRKDYVASTKQERMMRRVDDSSTMYTSSGEYHCEQCEIEARQKRGSQVIPEKVIGLKDNAEVTINEQLSKLNLPHRVELSEEQLDELVLRFTDIMRSITDQPRTREAFQGIMQLIQLFYWELDRNAGRLRGPAKTAGSRIVDDDHVRNVIFLVREEIEQFTGGKSVKPFFRHFKMIIRIMKEDEATRVYFHDLYAFMDRLMTNPQDYLNRKETALEIRDYILRSRNLKNREVSDHLYDGMREGRRLLKKITQDPVLTRMRNDFTRLIDDITKDSYGNFKLDGDVWNQLRLILTYSVVERVRIPLPPIEHEDEKRQYRVKDVMLNLRDFVPQRVTLEDHARMQFDVTDLRHPRVRKTRNIIGIYLDNIHFEVKDVDIWFRRKRAPHMETNMKANVEIGAEGRRGLDLCIELVSKPGSPGMFQVYRVAAAVNSLRIHVADTGMAFMYNAVLKIIKRRISAKIERSIEEGIRNGLETLNRVLVERIGKPTRRAAHAAGEKAGEMDIQDILRRFGETPLGQQAMRGVHMAKGDTHAGQRDRRHAKKHAKHGLHKGKKHAEKAKELAKERIGDHYDSSSDYSSSSSATSVNISSVPVQQTSYTSSYSDRSIPSHTVECSHCDECSRTQNMDGSVTEKVVHQEKVTRM